MKRKTNKILIAVEGIDLGKGKNLAYLREIFLLGLDELTEAEFETPIRFPIMRGKKQIGEVIAV